MLLADFLDRPIAFHRTFVRLNAGIAGALMLSQAIYWSRRTSDADGWFYKTQVEWTDETGLSRFEQEGARQKLRATGVLLEERRGAPARLFYRVDFDALERVLAADLSQTRLRKTSNLECGKAALLPAGFPQSLTESTPETTSETDVERRRERACRLPSDFEPNSEWAIEQGLSPAEVARERDRFRDHWDAAPGQRGVKRDWDATWRNWVRGALDRRPMQRRSLSTRPQPDGLFAICEDVRSTPMAGDGDVIEHKR